MSQPPPQQPQQPRSTGLVVGLAFAGFFAYILINILAGLTALAFNSELAVGVAAGFLALGSIGGGVALLLLRRPWAKGLGLGLMIGWGLVSIVSAGWCTGLNPQMYG